MNKGSYSFRLGHFECSVINDGMFLVPEIKTKQSPDLYNRIHPGEVMEINNLLIRTGKHNILFDTGEGADKQPGSGNLVQNLETMGLQREEIDTVILSHGHGDHISGITDDECEPVFPNARYIMSREEWDFWTSDPNLSNLNDEEEKRQMFAKSIQSNLIPVKDRMELINGDPEIEPGIELIRAPGHTPGKIIVVVSSGSERLVSTFDLIHQPSDLARPDLYSVFDIQPEQGCRTRMKILSQLIPDNPLVFACHFPFPGLGHIVPEGDAWMWKPLGIEG